MEAIFCKSNERNKASGREKPAVGTPNMGDGSDNVRVVVRCRPLSEQEVRGGHQATVKVDKIAKTISVESQNDFTKTFTFDQVFDWNSDQITIYNSVARPIVENVLKGYNGTIFAYGQTGTGKTYTMSGEDGNPEERGIIPNSFAHIFDHISKCNHDKTFLVRVSYLEIYNEEIRDLLAKNQDHHGLEVKERPDIGVFVKNLSNVTVSSADHMFKIMQFGNLNRHIGATNMNQQSSRSHALFTVTIECSQNLNGHQHLTQGKLHLVDLAGSERQSKTGASGDRLKEASKINLSLSTLGNVISALVDAKSTHIPYRNSKLTRLLQDSLGGNSKTVMIANIGPATYNYDETISTLRYANRAKNIKNVARINEDPKDAMLRKFQQEIEQLRKQLENDDEGSDDSEFEDEQPSEERKGHYEDRIKHLESDIADRRKHLDDVRNIGDDDRRRLATDLLAKERDLNSIRQEYDTLQQKLAAIERKLIIGGENLLEKAEKQAQLLDQSNIELEQARATENDLRKRLEDRQAERLDIEEKYNSLQEEVMVKNKKLKRAFNHYHQAKAELEDIETEHQREMEGLLENVRELQKELKLYIALIEAYIPEQFVDLIEKYVCWNDENGEWQLKCIAYTGNNMRSAAPISSFSRVNEPQLRPVYLSYNDFVDTKVEAAIENPRFRPKSAMKDRQTAKIMALLD
ncbi:unnamed protein product [Bursaphelenchus xylophilus]|uniref:Kinesin-like protein n=1 Tax=Bursaphelenchus xylophilus TaxID=6326 RepID=A0A1I7STI9_BURXY|nr:unnamed protein product [Bursaphelenchus xylophilus]CAG9108360.1 unnamed protein product [Bursaphelenchus xylophilus]